MYFDRRETCADRRPDEALAEAACRGSGPEAREALEELLARLGPRVYRHCLRVLEQREDAADATQDILVRIVEKLDTFDPRRGGLAAWTFSITRNHCLNVLRAKRVREGTGRRDVDTVVSRAVAVDAAVEDAAALDELLERLGEVLEPIEVDALVLRYVEGLRVDEITRVLGIETASGARGVLQRARRKLRRRESRWIRGQ